LPKINKELLNAYINVSNDKIESAEILFKNKKYDDAISRAYYAVFHCAQALLQSIGVKAESHSGVRQLFGLHFIKEGRLNKKFGKYLKNLKDEQENGDYGIFTLIDREDAQEAIKEAREFIAETEKYLKEKNIL
jgi:uncharacterized protein (UPF0332 family)